MQKKNPYSRSIVYVCNRKLDKFFGLNYTENMKIKNIKDIADVITGYTFRKALDLQSSGSMAVVQSKHVLDKLYIVKDTLPKIDLQPYHTKAIIKEHDIIISSRGAFKASIIRGDVISMIASSSVYILRIKDENTEPEYLAIYLNSISGQKKIKEKTGKSS